MLQERVRDRLRSPRTILLSHQASVVSGGASARLDRFARRPPSDRQEGALGSGRKLVLRVGRVVTSAFDMILSLSVRVLAVIPAFNEAKSLPRVIEGLRHQTVCDICVVDDGSTDDTAAVAIRQGAIVLRNAMNLGIGGAVQAGYLWALEHGYDVAVQVDGDGQHDAGYLSHLLAPIAEQGIDFVIGSRFLTNQGFRSTALRRTGIRYLSWVLRLRCGARVTDPTSGFRAAGRRAIELFARSYPSDYPEPEAIALATRSGLRVCEVPVQMSERSNGVSSINAWRTVYYFIKVSLALILLPSRPAPGAFDVEDPRS